MNKKKFFYILSGAILIFVLVVAVYISTFVQPKMVFTAKITTVSNEDYKRILDNVQVKNPNKDIEKFKHIKIQMNVTEPIGLNNHVKIEKDLLNKYLENNNKIQILSGGSSGQENVKEKEYNEKIEIYLNDLSENELINSLKDFKYKVTWSDLWNNKNNRIFYLTDYLQ